MKTRAKKIVIGKTTCLCCDREIPAKQSETGTLDVSCQWCDLPTYAKVGTESHKRLMARVTRTVSAPVAGVHVNEVGDPPNLVPPSTEKPVARAARSFFDLSRAGA